MSALKIPTQFPWVVAAVVVAHGILAIFLFGGTGEATRKPKTAVTEMTSTATETPALSAAAHPLGKTGSANSESNEALPPIAGTYGEADNAEFEPRFPKRIPRQSELNAAIAATDGPVTAEDIFNATEAENHSVPDAGPKPPSSTPAEKKGSSILSLPSAVAAAKAAPFAKTDLAKVEPVTPKDSSTRLRMVERTVPIPVTRTIVPKTTATPKVIRAEPIVETNPKPKLRFKTSLPSISKVKPIERVERAQPRSDNRPPPVPSAPPSNQRKFRVVKPLPR